MTRTTGRTAAIPIDERLLPDEDDVRFYREHGWFVSRPVLPTGFQAELQAVVDRFNAGERDARLPVADGHIDWRPGMPGATRINEHASYQLADLRRILLQPVIGAIAARLVGTDEIRLMEDTLVHKEPAGSGDRAATGWHTDDAYSSNCTSRDTVTAWVPLHAVDADRAPLVVLDGSHRWPGIDHLRHFNDPDMDGLVDRLRLAGHDIREVPIELEPGRVSFHHARTVHGSRPNRSALPRTAFAVQLQPGENRYRDVVNAGRVVHHYLDGVARIEPATGRPDYRDPRVFPVVWQAGV
ncbi:phytanoyl-CoA dioxygenase family protein [Pseudonocardia sp. McavD-2-B]|uniref:phytanoyl-CoA dioxygenase family protein n=1 Tax=Pseudonocardia sp. McavD-2-B TaxID=2954499 RepID=UPI00209703DA|nr:phytanoyl-CoA dioxygenase family protein [Pseudonocardia sp. McavD-2-B]MCO7193208.1 phytanoyl-CoA dioxygenase family protein [Pseudonocardia sp. McavD-2-B]